MIMHQTKEKLKHCLATVLQYLSTLQHLRWGRQSARRRSSAGEAGLRPGEAGGDPSGGASGFNGDRRCLVCAVGLAGFLQMKPEAEEVRSTTAEQGGRRASFPVLR